MKKVEEFLKANESSLKSILNDQKVYVFNPKELLDLINEPDFCQNCQEVACECGNKQRK